MPSLKDSYKMPSNVGPVISPAQPPAPPPPNDAATRSRTTFPTPFVPNTDALNLWLDRSKNLPTRGRLLPVAPGLRSGGTSGPSTVIESGAAAQGEQGPAGPAGKDGAPGAGGAQTITQIAHGLGVTGAVIPVFFKESTSLWTLAKADNANTLGMAVAVVVDSNTLTLYLTGLIAGFVGLTPGEYYFVSDSVAGTWTTTEPTSTTSFSNPMLLATDVTTAELLEFRPCAVGVTTIVPAVVTVTTTPTSAAAGNTYRVDTTTGNKVVNLPAASLYTGISIIIIKISPDVSTVTVNANGTDKILGQSSFSIAFQWTAIELQSNGAGWDIV